MRDADVKREIKCMTQHRSNTHNPVDFPVSPATMRARCEALVIAMVVKNWLISGGLAQTRHLVATLQNRFIVWHPVLCMLT
jgi:hypothetical protein